MSILGAMVLANHKREILKFTGFTKGPGQWHGVILALKTTRFVGYSPQFAGVHVCYVTAECADRLSHRRTGADRG